MNLTKKVILKKCLQNYCKKLELDFEYYMRLVKAIKHNLDYLDA